MIEFNSKILTIIINILLFPWLLTQWLPGIIGLAIFHNYEWYKNEYSGVKVLKVNKGYFNGGACFSLGPVIFVTPDCSEETVKHETGHSLQSIIFGPLFHIIVSIPSVILFIIRKRYNKSAEWYYSFWPEGGHALCAEELGHTNRQTTSK